MLSVRDLVKDYGPNRVVNGVSFTVERGEIFGLLGVNGAGKTTTLECLAGLRSPDSGTIHICGWDLASHPNEVKKRIGVALQSTALQDRITPREAVELLGGFYPRRVETPRLLERFSLLDEADDYFETLSGGQRQRLALALAFVNEPELLFLDEPTAGLDARGRRDLHGGIVRLREEGRTVLLTTHYIEEASLLSAGRRTSSDIPKGFRESPPAPLNRWTPHRCARFRWSWQPTPIKTRFGCRRRGWVRR